MTIILIGMPGSGKTTIGKELSKNLGIPAIDTDDLIVKRTGKSIKDLLNENFNQVEADVVKSISLKYEGIVSTGGSVVYSDEAMIHLREIGRVIYLQVPIEELITRIKNFDARGIVIRPDQTFEDLYNERRVLYERWADTTIHNDNLADTISIISKNI